MTSKSVPVSVVICTRDRPDDLRRCLASVAALEPAPKEVIVVDQGETPFHPPPGLPSFRHERMRERGLSRARNRGLSLARESIVAFLDDDCVVPRTWAADVHATFARHADAGLVFGTVVGSNEAQGAYVPTYSVERERTFEGRWAASQAHGMGAAMYVRSSVRAVVGEFDPRLGAGGDFHSSEDWDYTFRALAAGIVVVETPAIVVRHFGARNYADGSAGELLRRNAYSHGAVHAKLLRCLDPIAAVLVLSELGTLIGALRPWNALMRRPTNGARLLHYVRGLLVGLRAPVRRKERLFGKVAAQTLT